MRIGIGIGIGFHAVASWTPASLPGLQLWLTAGPAWCFQDAAKLTPCGNGDPVYTWADRAAGRDLVQATAAARPTLVLEGGVWRVRFAGTDDELSWTAGTSFSGPALTIGAAAVPGVSGAHADLLRARDLTLGNLGSAVRVNTNKVRGSYETSTGVKAVDSDADWLSGVAGSFAWNVNANLAYRHRFNGAEKTGTHAGAAVSRTIDFLNVGNVAGSYFVGDMTGIVVGNADLASEDAVALEAYLAGLLPA